MNQYEVIESFYMYRYNSERKFHKLIRYEKGSFITDTIARSMSNQKFRYIKQVTV